MSNVSGPETELEVRMFRKVSLSCALAVLSSSAFADPIPDNAYAAKKVGWFPSNQTSCRVICGQQQGGIAEWETFTGASWNNSATFTCKGRTQVADPWGGSGWLYGNNFNSPSREKVCMVSTAAGGAQRLTSFWCLCVLP